MKGEEMVLGDCGLWRSTMNELENISWDEFGSSDDHIVPRQSVDEIHECVSPNHGHKKPRYGDAGNSVNSRRSCTKTVLLKGDDTYFRTPMKDEKCAILEGSLSHASEGVVPASCNSDFISNNIPLASQDARTSTRCFNDCNFDAVSNKLLSKDAIPGNKVSLDGNACSSYMSIDEVIPGTINREFLDCDKNDKENDFVYHDLPDIGYFGDIDRMFRSCDATFEEGLKGTAEDLSWFSSSSNTIYGSEITFDSGLQSSSSKLSSGNCTSAHESLSNFCYEPYLDMLDTKSENLCESEHDGQISLHLKKNESRYLPEENTVQHLAGLKFDSSGIFTRACSSRHFPKQSHLCEPASSSSHTSNRHAQMEDNDLANQPFSQNQRVNFDHKSDPSSYNIPGSVLNYTQCMQGFPDQMYISPIDAQDKLDKVDRQQLWATVAPELCPNQSSFTNIISTQKRHGYSHENGADRKLKNIGLVPAAEVDFSVAKDGSLTASICPDDISVEATSLALLQNVIEQLDVSTKLCIRDSLYRLARSATRRHDFTDRHNHTRLNQDTRRAHCTDAHKKCSEFIDDAETVTNPIDRSMAHLLFTGLPDPATGSSVR